ncbi:uncharacterized protein B0T23DRAFT_432255 [Neurospora hispaniola]|uniref:Uncharacterized protein n=1 Tax=Neurospora hispaniola TaxID=588809 RepID=A0AAJ0I1B2_9PEZI|nr:hypothetical protein B0T23DRAFT_432255 [Neurospora hispaniola]
MARGIDDKFQPVVGEGNAPCKVYWLVGPPSQERGHVVGTKQKIKYFGVIEVRPKPDLPGFQNVICVANIWKLGPNGESVLRNTEEFSYDNWNPVFSFNGIPADINPPDQSFCRYILLRHIHFPEAGTYRLEMTVKAFCVINEPGQPPQINHVNIDEVTKIHIEVKDGVTWNEQRTHPDHVKILALLEWYPVLGCARYMDKETGEIKDLQPMYCGNPRQTGDAQSIYAKSEAGSSEAGSLVTVIHNNEGLEVTGGGNGNQAEEDVD